MAALPSIYPLNTTFSYINPPTLKIPSFPTPPEFQYDDKWKDDPGYVHYDYTSTEGVVGGNGNGINAVPSPMMAKDAASIGAPITKADMTISTSVPIIDHSLFGTFDMVVIDPPFLSSKVWGMYAMTTRSLLRNNSRSFLLPPPIDTKCERISNGVNDGNNSDNMQSNSDNDYEGGGMVMGTTILENRGIMHDLFGVKPNVFRPVVTNLVYQYEVYTNFRTKVLSSSSVTVSSLPLPHSLLSVTKSTPTSEQYCVYRLFYSNYLLYHPPPKVIVNNSKTEIIILYFEIIECSQPNDTARSFGAR